MYISTHS